MSAVAIEVPMSVRPLFLAAGWSPGHPVAVPSTISIDHPAANVLAQFGGLKVGKVGAGEECATSDVCFGEVYPNEDITRVWGSLLGSELIGVAEVHHAHEALYVDIGGRYYGASTVHDAFYFYAETFGETMERLLLGRRSRPMLRPDQASVGMYGEEIAADHPSVYHYW